MNKNKQDRRRKLKFYGSYHVISKINRDEIIFNDAVSDLYEETIIRCKEHHSFKVHAFSVMGNHVHLLLTPGKDSPLPRIMQWINSVFARKYNKLTGQSGHVWKERYYSVIMETAKQFIAVFEYIVNNPLNAKLVKYAKYFRHSGLYHYLHNVKSIISCAEGSVIAKLYEHCKDFHT